MIDGTSGKISLDEDEGWETSLWGRYVDRSTDYRVQLSLRSFRGDGEGAGGPTEHELLECQKYFFRTWFCLRDEAFIAVER